MSNVRSFRRIAALAAVLAPLAVGTALPAHATSTLETHGLWSSVVDTDSDGNRICGVRTRMDGNAELRLLVIGDRIHLVAFDSDWHMRADSTVHTTVDIDDAGYRGDAKVIDGQTLMVVGLTRSFVADFMAGDEMVANFGGVRWRVNLEGSAQATADMAACVAAVSGGLTS